MLQRDEREDLQWSVPAERRLPGTHGVEQHAKRENIDLGPLLHADDNFLANLAEGLGLLVCFNLPTNNKGQSRITTHHNRSNNNNSSSNSSSSNDK